MDMSKSGSQVIASRELASVNGAESKDVFVLIDGRALERECIAECIAARHQNTRLQTFDSVDKWTQAANSSLRPMAIMFHLRKGLLGSPDAQQEIRKLVSAAADTPVVVLGDFSNSEEVEFCLRLGARGCIPVSIGLDSIFQAARLASTVGGAFIPASNILEFSSTPKTVTNEVDVDFDLTSRQMEVANALRSGKANKTIAYELQMRESTVKVHVRAIMKKLSATNRTQAAIILNSKLAEAAATPMQKC